MVSKKLGPVVLVALAAHNTCNVRSAKAVHFCFCCMSLKGVDGVPSFFPSFLLQLFMMWFTCFRRTDITAAVVAVRIRTKKETRRGNIKMKGEIRTESTKVVHPAKTRSTRALVLGNLTDLA